MNTYSALIMLKANQGILTSQIITNLLTEHAPIAKRMRLAYENYKAEKLQISTREPSVGAKVTSKINNDYRGEIVDQGVGYLFGKPITYQLNKEAKEYKGNDTAYKADQDQLQEFLKASFVEDLDKETGKKGSICGSGARLCYVDKLGQSRVMNLMPWEVIFIQDASLDVNQYVLRYYEITEVVDGKPSTRTRVEWYDSKTVTFYISDNNKNFVLDTSEPANPMPHLFDMVPVIEFPNNEERLNDFKKVEASIDAYDMAVSIAQDELEEFRHAYLAFFGCTVNKEVIDLAKETGALSLPGDGAKAEFLTKDIKPEFYIEHKKTLKENIYRFSKTVNMSAETFSGSGASGETRKWLLLTLEFRVGTQQLKFAKALVQMFQVLTTFWAWKSMTLSWKNITFTFDRNIPAELLQETEIQMNLKGVVSDKTRFGLASFIRDPEAEIQAMEEENAGKVDLDAPLTPEEQAAKDAADAKAAADEAAAAGQQ